MHESVPVGRSTRAWGAACVFAMAFVLSSVPVYPFFFVVLAYGTGAYTDLLPVLSPYLGWMQPAVSLPVFYLAYRLGKRMDLRGDYLLLGLTAFAGALLGATLQLMGVTTTSTGSSAVTTWGFSIRADTVAQMLVSSIRVFAIPCSGLALAFFGGMRARTLYVVGPERRFPSPQLFFGLTLVIVMASYLAMGVVDVIGPYPAGDQFAFLRAVFVASPYATYAFDLFYPILFFVVFYYIGKRMGAGGWMRSMSYSVLAAGVIGFVIGNPLTYLIRSLAASPGHTLALPSFSPLSVVGAFVDGLELLALGYAASSFGLVRAPELPSAPIP